MCCPTAQRLLAAHKKHIRAIYSCGVQNSTFDHTSVWTLFRFHENLLGNQGLEGILQFGCVEIFVEALPVVLAYLEAPM